MLQGRGQAGPSRSRLLWAPLPTASPKHGGAGWGGDRFHPDESLSGRAPSGLGETRSRVALCSRGAPIGWGRGWPTRRPVPVSLCLPAWEAAGHTSDGPVTPAGHTHCSPPLPGPVEAAAPFPAHLGPPHTGQGAFSGNHQGLFWDFLLRNRKSGVRPMPTWSRPHQGQGRVRVWTHRNYPPAAPSAKSEWVRTLVCLRRATPGPAWAAHPPASPHTGGPPPAGLPWRVQQSALAAGATALGPDPPPQVPSPTAQACASLHMGVYTGKHIEVLASGGWETLPQTRCSSRSWAPQSCQPPDLLGPLPALLAQRLPLIQRSPRPCI